jgi:hypothetical protein
MHPVNLYVIHDAPESKPTAGQNLATDVADVADVANDLT